MSPEGCGEIGQCPLLALSGHLSRVRKCPLLRVKRTLDNYFLCFAKLLKSATRSHPLFAHHARIKRGFTFLGYQFSRQPLRLATNTVRHFAARLHRIYEQQKTALGGAAVLGDYVTRWLRWTHAGLRELDCSGLPLLAFAGKTQPGEADQRQS